MRKLAYLALGLLTMLPINVLAQDADRVVVVPYSQKFPELPHPAYEGDRKTLKAVIQNASCNVGYQVTWDTNLDKNYDNDNTITVARNGDCNCVRDAGILYTIGDVAQDEERNIDVRVKNLCNNQLTFGTFQMYIYDFRPSDDASKWVHPNANQRTVTKEQLEIMTQSAIQEGLWHIHRKLAHISGSGATMTGRPSDQWGAPIELWSMLINGHLPAYPPNVAINGTKDCNNNNECHQGYDINGDGVSDYGKEECISNECLPDGFDEANDRRFLTDPYAETVMRLANYMASGAGLYGIVAGQEGNRNGWTAPGQASTIAGQPAPFNTRLDGANGDRNGAYATGSRTRGGGQQDIYRGGMNLGGIAPVLPALHGTVLQVGNNDVKGQKWEWFVQQLTDYLAAQQIDDGGGNGGWYYHDMNGSYGGVYSDASSTQWAYIGLESAEIAGGPFGVIVDNLHKYRIADNLVHNQQGDGGAGYRSTHSPGDAKLTGGSLVAARWLKFNNFPDDGTKPFGADEDFGNKKHSEFIDIYENYLGFIASSWNTSGRRGTHWSDSLWQNGDYLCSDNSGVYNQGTCGDTYALYSIQKGLRTGAPLIETVGGADWVTEFNTYYIRAMRRYEAGTCNGRICAKGPGDGNYDDHGKIRDANNWGHHKAIGGHGSFVNSMGVLTMTPSIFSPRPVAKAGVGSPDDSTAEVIEGCVDGEGKVKFFHGDSFHPNPERRIVLYQWDFDDSNGLWWENDALNPDFFTPKNFQTELETEHTYQTSNPDWSNGAPTTYTATLRVVENVTNNAEEPLDDTTKVTVIVRAAANQAPSAVHGGPYTVQEESALTLDGSSNDLNSTCDELAQRPALAEKWQVFKNGGWVDIPGAQGVDPVIPWATIENLNLQGNGVANRIRLFVEDSGAPKLSGSDETTLKIYGKDPVAVATVNPGTAGNPAACNAEVTFDCNASTHPNPARVITTCEWNVDGAGGFEGNDKIFRYSYDAFGALPDRTYSASLKVTDDAGGTNVLDFDVHVSAGNQAPTARVSSNNYVVLEGDTVTLDAAASEDANAQCGDAISSYVWTLSDGTELGQGRRLDVTWDQLQALGNRINFPADTETGLPTNIVTMTVTDTFGASSSVQTKLTIYRAKPTARVVQTPNPAMIRRGNGLAEVELNGGESTSPIPGRQISDFEWVFDRENEPDANTVINTTGRAVNFVKVFDPVPTPDTIPNVYVWLRVTDDGDVRRTSDWERYQVSYNVPPTLPTADADPTDPPEKGYDIIVGGDLLVDGSQSFDPDDDDFVRFYRWDFSYDENDGMQPTADSTIDDENGVGGEVAKLTISWEKLSQDFGINGAGTYTIGLEVQDNFGQTNMDTAKLTVHERDPVVSMIVNPNPAACGAQVTFDASDSDHPHPDIDVSGYAWDFDNDGAFDDGEGAVTTYRFSEYTFTGVDALGNQLAGSIPVGVKVVDTEGNTAEIFEDMEVNLGNAAPSPSAGGYRTADDPDSVAGPYAIAAGENISLSADLSFDPDELCGDYIVSYSWDLKGDGSFEYGDAANGDGVASMDLNLTWQNLVDAGIDAAGTYTVLVRATDRFGVSADATASLVVTTGPEAAASADPASQGCEELVEFSASRSRGEGPQNQGFDLVSYEWDFDTPYFQNDADVDATGEVVNRAVAALPVNGETFVEAMVRVTDASGRTDTQTIRVNIQDENIAPIADAGGPYSTGCLGNCNNRQFSKVQLDGRSSVDPNGACDDLVVYKWDTDNDGLFGNDDNPPDLTGAFPQPFSRDGANGWNPGTVQQVKLIVCDIAGLCSPAKSANIRVNEESPPSGELLSPRAGECVGAGNLDVVFKVSDPEGETITVEVEVNGQVIGTKNVDTPVGGAMVQQTITVNANDVGEGNNNIVLNFDDTFGGESSVDSGGAVTFDRTAPAITIGAQPVANVCYQPNNVPDADISVQDAGDDAPVYSTNVTEDGCGRTLTVTAVDACGNEGTASRDYRVASPVELTITGAEEGELVPDARIEWEVDGLDTCAAAVTATYSLNGQNQGPYPEGQLLSDAGNYAINISAQNCLGVARNLIRNFTVNAPPVVVPLPGGHPNQNPADPTQYLVDEGQSLLVDGSSSRAPEQDDRIVAYEWDWDAQDGLSFQSIHGCDPAQSFDLTGAAEVMLQPWDMTHTASCVRVDPGTEIVWMGGGNHPLDDGIRPGDDAVAGLPANPVANAAQGNEIRVTFTDSGLYPYYCSNHPNDMYGMIIVNEAGAKIPSLADGNGVSVSYPTDDNGQFTATLRVTDDLGASNSEQVVVKIDDVKPTADGGGPYVTNQGVEITFDASGSRPGSPINPQTGATADPITAFSWDWDDGSDIESGANLDRPTHTFAEHGVYNVKLKVTDEEPDSFDEVVIRVEVRDVDPVVQNITWPQDLYEIRPMDFELTAQPGAPGDPITRVEWDMEQDGAVDYFGVDAFLISHQFETAGTYTVTVKVADGDSDVLEARQVTVAEITLLKLLTFLDERARAEAIDEQNDLQGRLALARIVDNKALDYAIWGENQGRRGNTMLSTQKVVDGLVEAHQAGIDLSLELWALSRQLRRELASLRSELLEGRPELNGSPSLNRADDYIARYDAIYTDADFRQDISGVERTFLVQDLVDLSTEAYFWLSDLTDQCNAYNRFTIGQYGSRGQLMDLAEGINNDMNNAFDDMKSEMQQYVNEASAAASPGPGSDDVNGGMNMLTEMMSLAVKPLRDPCPQGVDCISDREALEMELDAMDLVKQLTLAETRGVWVRNWQTCLTMALKFRIEMSMKRVEFVCGVNLELPKRARTVQKVGLDMVTAGDYPGALQYYAGDDRTCLMVEVYNQCIVPNVRGEDDEGNFTLPLDPWDTPAFCADDDDAQ